MLGAVTSNIAMNVLAHVLWNSVYELLEAAVLKARSGNPGASRGLPKVFPRCRNYFHSNAEISFAFHAHALTSVQWRAGDNATGSDISL